MKKALIALSIIGFLGFGSLSSFVLFAQLDGLSFPEFTLTTGSNAAAVVTADTPWRKYEVYDPKVEQITIYDAEYETQTNRRITDPETGDAQVFCEDTYHRFGEHCYWLYEDPKIYNHMSTLAYYDGLWYIVWGTNNKIARKSEVTGRARPNNPGAKEGVTGQHLVFATSRDFKSWTEPERIFDNPDFSENPVERDVESRNWVPDLIVVGNELWSFWMQTGGRKDGLYFSRLSSSDGKWVNTKLDLPNNVFTSSGAIELRSGRVVVPVSIDSGGGNAAIYTDDDGESWNLSGVVRAASGMNPWEPKIIEDINDSNTIYMYIRNRDSKDRPSSEMLLYSKSTNGGETWSDYEYAPIEVPELRTHLLTHDDRYIMLHHDLESAWSGNGGREDRTGRRVGLEGPDAAQNERTNIAMFFSREGTPGTFLPGPAISGLHVGASYHFAEKKGNKLYTVHSAQGMVGEIISDLPPEDTYLLYPRTSLILEEDAPSSEMSTYTYRSINENTKRIDRQNSMSIETDQARYSSDEAIQLQFEFVSHRKQSVSRDERIALLTIGGPDDYGMIEIGRPGYSDQIVFVRGNSVTPIGSYAGDWTLLDVVMSEDGITVTAGDNEVAVDTRPFDVQKFFFGYGYLQGESYEEEEYNPDGFVTFRVNTVRSRITSTTVEVPEEPVEDDRDAALEAIDDAEREIERAEDELRDADEDDVDINEVEDLIDDAKADLVSAENAFDDEDYDSALDYARRAEAHADDALDELDVDPAPRETSISDSFTFNRNISFNRPEMNVKDDVENLQIFLNEFENEDLSVDGTYDSDDNEAIKRFQRKYKREILDVWNLTEATGFVGITTRLKMNFLLKGQTAQCPVFTEFNGGRNGIMESSEIGETQKILADLDMYDGPINNVWTRDTNTALITFQETFREVMLDPWGISEGTGYKYKTTNKFLNYMAGCDTGAVNLEGVGVYEGL